MLQPREALLSSSGPSPLPGKMSVASSCRTSMDANECVASVSWSFDGPAFSRATESSVECADDEDAHHHHHHHHHHRRGGRSAAGDGAAGAGGAPAGLSNVLLIWVRMLMAMMLVHMVTTVEVSETALKRFENATTLYSRPTPETSTPDDPKP